MAEPSDNGNVSELIKPESKKPGPIRKLRRITVKWLSGVQDQFALNAVADDFRVLLVYPILKAQLEGGTPRVDVKQEIVIPLEGLMYYLIDAQATEYREYR